MAPLMRPVVGDAGAVVGAGMTVGAGTPAAKVGPAELDEVRGA